MSKTTKPKTETRGRPKSSESRGAQIAVRYSEEEKVRWNRAAIDLAQKTGEPVTLSEWIRHVLNAASGG